MHDEPTEHAAISCMAMWELVEVGACLVNVEFIDVTAAGFTGSWLMPGMPSLPIMFRSHASGWSSAQVGGCRRLRGRDAPWLTMDGRAWPVPLIPDIDGFVGVDFFGGGLRR